jgi:hypothetical protein
MSDPFSIERLLGSSAAGAVAAAGIAGVLATPGPHYGGGRLVLSDEQLRPLLLDYVQRLLSGHAPKSGIDAIFSDPEPRFYTQGSHPLQTEIRPTLYADHHGALPYDFDLLEARRSDIASLARFSHHVDYANWHFCAALDASDEPALLRKPAKRARIRTAPKTYFAEIAAYSFDRWQSVRAILIHAGKPSEEAQPLCRAGFWSLCELTPANSQLKQLFEMNPVRACHELVSHVDVVVEQLEMTTRLAEDLSNEDAASAKADDAARLAALQSELLDKAGDRLSLTQAAERLSMTRQALHKKIKTGAALGLMIGDTFVLPAAQLIEGESGTSVVAHLRNVLSLFTDAGAGNWSALQYLVEPDSALGGAAPLDQLKAGDVATVVAGARAYLGLDDG